MTTRRGESADPRAGQAAVVPALDDATSAYAGAHVDEVLAAYADLVPEDELAWMRARLLDEVASDPALRELAVAARPRAVERSGQIARSAALPGPKKAPRGGRR